MKKHLACVNDTLLLSMIIKTDSGYFDTKGTKGEGEHSLLIQGRRISLLFRTEVRATNLRHNISYNSTSDVCVKLSAPERS